MDAGLRIVRKPYEEPYDINLIVTSSTGHCAVIVRFNNNSTIPDTEISEFSIPAEAAQINRLGKCLVQFAKLEDDILD